MDIDVDLRLKGKVVTRCYLDGAFGLEFWEKGSRTVIRITRIMRIEQGGLELELSAEKTTEAAQASILLRKTIAHAVGLKDGTLDVSFSDGTRLIVPVDPDYEAWEVSGDDGFLVVSRPGGGLAVWGPREVSSAYPRKGKV